MFELHNIESPEEMIRAVADNVDRLVALDLPFRGVAWRLYRDARAKVDAPLSYLAASALFQALGPGDVVLINTGWPDRPHINPSIAETDGPPGAVALGLALHKAAGAVPVFLVEEALTPAMVTVGAAAGFKMLPPSQAVAASSSRAPLHAAAALGFPADGKEAERYSASLLEELPVKAAIAVEKGGMNEKGVIHTSRGDNTTAPLAKADFLMQAAIRAGLPTVGIGDGGNEIGMGVIADELRAWLPYGVECRCGCGSGIVPATKTDHLVAAAVSNWGAYGLCAVLALLAGRSDVMHGPELEKRILEATVSAGLIDGGSGYVSGGADALPGRVHEAVVTMLGELVDKGLAQLGKQG